MSKTSLLHEILHQDHLDAILVSSPTNIRYLTGYEGFSEHEHDAYLLITKNKNIIFTSTLYSEAIRLTLPEFTLFETNQQNSFYQNLKTILEKEKCETLGFEDTDLTVAEFLKIQKYAKECIPTSLHAIRSTKTNEEITLIEQACSIGDQALSLLLPQIKLGLSELQVARILELRIKELDGDLSFPTIVAFGKNAAVPHHHTDQTTLNKNDIILLDFGVRYKGYCSDMTRTVFFGEAENEQSKAYDAVLASQTKAVEYISSQLSQNKPCKASLVDKAARDYLISTGFSSIPHSLGHGIGLQVHESPSLSPKSEDILEEGMVFSIEPGIYLSEKFGIRIEDLYTINNKQLIQLTKSSSELRILH